MYLDFGLHLQKYVFKDSSRLRIKIGLLQCQVNPEKRDIIFHLELIFCSNKLRWFLSNTEFLARFSKLLLYGWVVAIRLQFPRLQKNSLRQIKNCSIGMKM